MRSSLLSPVNRKSPSLVDRLRMGYIADRCDKKLEPLPFDSVYLSDSARIRQRSKSIFSRFQKFGIDDYKSLSKLEKSVLREVNLDAKQVALDSIQVATKIKEKLDNDYGAGKYVFCCIGTSPSGLARVLEFMGVETRYLPISKLNWLPNIYAWKDYSDKFTNYENFLEEQGLSSSKIEKSDKHFLFYDYWQQGMSLIVFEEMMKEHFGFDLPNVKFESVNNLCYQSCLENLQEPEYSKNYIQIYMDDMKIEEYGGVPHLPIENIDKIDECKLYENLLAKSFNFFVIDELNKKRLLKYNPDNKGVL